MGTQNLILAIDNGTQSVRALVFDLQGNIQAKSKVELQPYLQQDPGIAEQQGDYFWQQLALACQELWQQNPGLKSNLVAVTLTTQRGTLIPVDEAGSPLAPAILWLDQRQAQGLTPMPWYWRLIFKCIGQHQTIEYFRSKAQVNWWFQNQPELWQQCHKFLLLSGFLTHRLCGEFHDSIGSMVGYLPFNYRKLRWCKKYDWKWHALNILPRHLPKLFRPGETLGKISPSAAQATGIPEGLPLVAAAADKACEVLGSGGTSANIGCMSYGTTATINTSLNQYVEPSAFVPPFPSAIPDQFNCEVMIYRGFWMVSWFKQEFGQQEVQRAEELEVPPEFLFDDLVNEVAPGSEGLMLQPYWSPGLKNLEAKGAIIGFGDHHTRAHLYRSILEGLAYALREGKETLERKQKQLINQLVVAGGGSQSDAAMQITADVFNLPVQRPHTYETSGLGAAMTAAVGVGLHKDMETARSLMTRPEKIFTPNPANARLYDALYRRGYLKMYGRLRPIYLKLRQISTNR